MESENIISSNEEESKAKKLKKFIIKRKRIIIIILVLIALICCIQAIKKALAKQELSIVVENTISQIKADKEAEAANPEDEFSDIYTIKNINYEIKGFQRCLSDTSAKNAYATITCNIDYKGMLKKETAERYFAFELLETFPDEYDSSILNCKIKINDSSMSGKAVSIYVNGKKYVENSNLINSTSNRKHLRSAGYCSHCNGTGVTNHGLECQWCNGTGIWAIYD